MRVVRIVSRYPYRFEVEDDMKCRECGRKRCVAHKMSCSSAKWGRTPEYVSDPSCDARYNAQIDRLPEVNEDRQDRQ